MSVGRRAAAIAVSVISPGSGGLVLGRPMRAAGWLLAMALAYPLDLLWPMAGLLAVVVLAIASIFDAGLMRPSTKPPSPAWAVLMVVVFYGANSSVRLAQRLWLVEPFQIPSEGMSPVLLPGDHFLVDHTARHYQVGDIVVFPSPTDASLDHVKRIAGVGGEVASFDAEGLSGGADEWQGKVIPIGTVFVVGDNTQHSLDSRSFGPIPVSSIKGRARVIHFSFADGVFRWSRIGTRLDRPSDSP